jgi:hypothetical protein
MQALSKKEGHKRRAMKRIGEGFSSKIDIVSSKMERAKASLQTCYDLLVFQLPNVNNCDSGSLNPYSNLVFTFSLIIQTESGIEKKAGAEGPRL